MKVHGGVKFFDIQKCKVSDDQVSEVDGWRREKKNSWKEENVGAGGERTERGREGGGGRGERQEREEGRHMTLYLCVGYAPCHCRSASKSKGSTGCKFRNFDKKIKNWKLIGHFAPLTHIFFLCVFLCGSFSLKKLWKLWVTSISSHLMTWKGERQEVQQTQQFGIVLLPLYFSLFYFTLFFLSLFFVLLSYLPICSFIFFTIFFSLHRLLESGTKWNQIPFKKRWVQKRGRKKKEEEEEETGRGK